ncbi:alpha/beta hydrolase [Shimia marina]|uniref:Alpha/beta hydrolase family protein n=1 Tax=Shimia marina TaxID=321267 RepID=A0A0P1EMI6_9RHOB|nr:alpha/beta fold hydrolase [Shimia marina]CUH51457.1 Alpha/beta hydrolase family protein [Shimia marina]SFD48626.1 Esterase/lipase superfamily enzyme [Shimia marina]
MRILTFALLTLTMGGCADRITAPVVPQALSNETTHKIYVATNRARNDAGFFGAERSSDMTYLDSVVSVPPSHKTGKPPSYNATPDPQRHFTIASETEVSRLSEFVQKVSSDVQSLPPRDREIILFVHGYHNTYQDSLFRTAQMKEDFEVSGAMVNFTWSSAGQALGYAHDRESVLFSRDDLERTLRAFAKQQPHKLLLVGHSLGTMLITETLRQIDRKEPGWTVRNIDALALLSPDMPVDLFLRNLESIKALPTATAIVTSTKDSALFLSSQINGTKQRLGQLTDPSVLDGLPIALVDVSNFNDSASFNHLTVAGSPALIALLRDARDIDTLLSPEDSTILSRSAERILVTGQTVAIEVGAPPN